jgi:hypothetical protein
VLGDLNEGPGLDYFEQLYLSHNVTDIMVGSAFQPEWIFAHSQHDVPAAERYTARSVRCTDGRASQDRPRSSSRSLALNTASASSMSRGRGLRR